MQGVRGQPCLSPLYNWNSFVFNPFIRMPVIAISYKVDVHQIQYVEKPIIFIIFLRNCQFIISYRFSKSRNNTLKSWLDSVAHCIAFVITTALFRMYISFPNHVYVALMHSCNNGWNRTTNTLVATL